jgi:asparagine synthase (glutamine-hydrolysing)
MCGLLFLESKYALSRQELFKDALKAQDWRGPDASEVKILNNRFLLGHNRLSILDTSMSGNQPMSDNSDRYTILYNGEIYNYLEIAESLCIELKTTCDTELLLEGFKKIGQEIFKKLNGMFACVILDTHTGDWIAARDCLGIKPLFYINRDDEWVISSEPVSVKALKSLNVDYQSVDEWRIFRRPVPGSTFFESLNELLPGHILKSDGSITKYWAIEDATLDREDFNQDKFEKLVRQSIADHCLSDVPITGLLSGGIDSAIVVKIADLSEVYTTGLYHENEILDARETASEIGVSLVEKSFTDKELVERWVDLLKMRQEPLSVPNEGLISLICSEMNVSQKVVLTGEGADELLFGYDRIFRQAISGNLDINSFVTSYGYDTSIPLTSRMRCYIESLWEGKSDIDFLEDFFIYFHLPGLLRRMDFSSMSSSKEARVPFVTKAIFEYLYRRDSDIKIDSRNSKKPFRKFLENISVLTPLSRKKIGFSAVRKNFKRDEDYKNFQTTCLDQLGW